MMIQKALGLFNRVLAAFIIFTVPFVFFQQSFDPFGPVQSMAAYVFLPLLIFSFLVSSVMNGRAVLKESRVLFPLGLYLAVSFASVFFSVNMQISLRYFAELFTAVTGAYFIYTMSEEADARRWLAVIMVSHTLMAFYGILQHFGADPFSWNTNFAGRPLGTIGNPDFFAGELLISLFLLASYLVFGRRFRMLAGISLAATLLCLYYTKVIGAYVGIGIGALVFAAILILSGRIDKKKAAMGTAVLLVIIIALGVIFAPKLKALIVEKQRSLTHRMLMWESSLLMTKDSPVIGKGLGSFRLNYPYYQGILLNDNRNKGYDYVVTWMPHQQYLHIAAETGIAGLGLFLAAIFTALAGALKQTMGGKRFTAATAGIISALAAILGASFFNTFYNITSTTFLFFLFLFLIQSFDDGHNARVLKGSAIKAAAAAAALLLLVMTVYNGRSFAANLYLKKGDSYSKKELLKEAVEYYERVIAIKPVELCPQTDVAQYYYAAEAYRKAGDLRTAARYYKEDLKLNPYCPEVNNMYGAVSGQLGDLDEAVKRLETAVFVAPHYDTAYTNLTTAYVAKGDFDGARGAIKRYMDRNGVKPEFESLLEAVNAAQKAGNR
ncbi:MAG: O-antigen ligase family protein [Spirochaetia bacterium]|nr:O-antigen ligase family protein [Spirochaetia bacterium]